MRCVGEGALLCPSVRACVRPSDRIWTEVRAERLCPSGPLQRWTLRSNSASSESGVRRGEARRSEALCRCLPLSTGTASACLQDGRKPALHTNLVRRVSLDRLSKYYWAVLTRANITSRKNPFCEQVHTHEAWARGNRLVLHAPDTSPGATG
jgi:hypothetical protein